MAHVRSPFYTGPGPSTVLWAGREPDVVVVRLRGEHDISTEGALCLVLARAIAADDASLVLDMSEVSFISASTLGVIIRAREFLRPRSRSLTVRSPSAQVRRVIETCGLDDLFGPSPGEACQTAAGALGPLVAVPNAEQPDEEPGRSTLRSGGPPLASDWEVRAWNL
jgi:anti-anti-sigma factor